MTDSAVEALDELIAHRLHPALAEQALRRRSRMWWAGDAESGWTLLAVARWKYNDRDRAQFSVDTEVWPTGSWTVYTELKPFASAARPSLDGNAPLSTCPQNVLPQRYAGLDWPWKIQVRPRGDLADEVVDYALEHALPTARRLLDIDVALRALADQPRRWVRSPGSGR